MKVHVRKLTEMGACEQAIDFATEFPSLEAAWLACERGDWMLWYVSKLEGPSTSESFKKCDIACAAILAANTVPCKMAIIREFYPVPPRRR